MSILLRLVRRLTVLESTSVDDYVQTECTSRDGTPDLSLSVYDVSETEVTRAVAEHAASFTDAPKQDRTSLAITRRDGLALRPTRGDGAFDFVRDTHRELELFDVDDLREVVGRMIPWSEHRHTTSPAMMGLYVQGRLAANDGEWTAACDRRKSWAKLASKHAPQAAMQFEVPSVDAVPTPDHARGDRGASSLAAAPAVSSVDLGSASAMQSPQAAEAPLEGARVASSRPPPSE